MITSSEFFHILEVLCKIYVDSETGKSTLQFQTCLVNKGITFHVEF